MITTFVKSAPRRVHLFWTILKRNSNMTPEMKSKMRTLLVKHEGIKNHLYKDTRNKWTIGVGHNIEDNGLTDPQIFAILDDDVNIHFNFLSTNTWFHALDENRQCVLIDLAFNVGDKNFDKFVNMIEALKMMDFKRASQEILNSELSTSRKQELAHTMLTGEL